MSLIVEVYVGSHLNKERRKLVATSVIHNVSNLADVSNYEGAVQEIGAEHLQIPPSNKFIVISSHKRAQSVWSLVKKIAERALDG